MKVPSALSAGPVCVGSTDSRSAEGLNSAYPKTATPRLDDRLHTRRSPDPCPQLVNPNSCNIDEHDQSAKLGHMIMRRSANPGYRCFLRPGMLRDCKCLGYRQIIPKPFEQLVQLFMLVPWKPAFAKQVVSDRKNAVPIAVRRMSSTGHEANEIAALPSGHLINPHHRSPAGIRSLADPASRTCLTRTVAARQVTCGARCRLNAEVEIIRYSLAARFHSFCGTTKHSILRLNPNSTIVDSVSCRISSPK